MNNRTQWAIAWIMLVYAIGLFFLFLEATVESVDRWGGPGYAVAAWAFVALVILMVPFVIVWRSLPSDKP